MHGGWLAYLLVTGPCMRRHDETGEWLGGPPPIARWATHDSPGALPLWRLCWSGTPAFVLELRGVCATIGPRLRHGVLEREVTSVPNLIPN